MSPQKIIKRRQVRLVPTQDYFGEYGFLFKSCYIPILYTLLKFITNFLNHPVEYYIMLITRLSLFTIRCFQRNISLWIIFVCICFVRAGF